MAGEGIQSFSQAAAESRYKAGFKGEKINFVNPIMPPDLTVKMGYSQELQSIQVTGAMDGPKLIDPWGSRKSK